MPLKSVLLPCGGKETLASELNRMPLVRLNTNGFVVLIVSDTA
jgi:hypothetical protein